MLFLLIRENGKPLSFTFRRNFTEPGTKNCIYVLLLRVFYFKCQCAWK